MSLVSVIIPAYNEQNVIKDCLESLKNQSYKELEIIVVDDGSTDNTIDIAKNYTDKILTQEHKGPGTARNLGVKNSKGKILVFVDADMTFDPNFISNLVKPIQNNQAVGTFSKDELVKNQDNIWSVCWNINKNLPKDRMIPINYPNQAPVFRAILKEYFIKAGGFSTSGEYTDDWSISQKLKIASHVAQGAIYYHSNPSSLNEVYTQARWIGKNKFLTGSIVRKIKSIIIYSFPLSIIIGFTKSLINLSLNFLVFKIIYDFGIFRSVVGSFFKEAKSK